MEGEGRGGKERQGKVREDKAREGKGTKKTFIPLSGSGEIFFGGLVSTLPNFRGEFGSMIDGRVI